MRKLFVMGGGGFAMEPENLLLDRYILSLSEKPRPKICYIGTASGDTETKQNAFYAAYQNFSCEPTHLSLFKPPSRDLTSFVRGQDIVHVGGGNSKNLLCLWKEWGLDRVLLDAYRDGLILTGMSAGMLCWFEELVTDSFGEGLEPIKGLGFLKGSACPHFDGEAERRPTYTRLIKEKVIQGGLALDDGVGALFHDERLQKCVSSRSSARAYLFETGTAAERGLELSLIHI